MAVIDVFELNMVKVINEHLVVTINSIIVKMYSVIEMGLILQRELLPNNPTGCIQGWVQYLGQR